ncbi:branched-chain amino acid ABC transporter permease [Nocardioides hungaricus]
MEIFGQAVVNGVMLASIYALVALGLTLIFGLLDVVNFAHGQMLLLGSYLTWAILQGGMSYWLALPLAALALVALGFTIDLTLFARVRNTPISGLIISIGLIAVFADVFRTVWGVDALTVPSQITTVFRPAGLVIPGDRVVIMVIAAAVMVLLAVFLKFSRLGVALRATADNPEAALLMGIPTERIRNGSFALGAGLSGLAGGLLAAVFPVVPTGGDAVLITGFIVLILGGAGSPLGAVAAALLIGMVESFGITYWSSNAASILGFALLIVVLFIRPSGIFSTSREVTL